MCAGGLEYRDRRDNDDYTSCQSSEPKIAVLEGSLPVLGESTVIFLRTVSMSAT